MSSLTGTPHRGLRRGSKTSVFLRCSGGRLVLSGASRWNSSLKVEDRAREMAFWRSPRKRRAIALKGRKQSALPHFAAKPPSTRPVSLLRDSLPFSSPTRPSPSPVASGAASLARSLRDCQKNEAPRLFFGADGAQASGWGRARSEKWSTRRPRSELTTTLTSWSGRSSATQRFKASSLFRSAWKSKPSTTTEWTLIAGVRPRSVV
mmetsp:Transcript_15286/g.51407  ORF Transcript_15286/g.51407 Transcript_15286/m.51407 type:complete len:206 (-) Transcript_15286:500-1117(-)